MTTDAETTLRPIVTGAPATTLFARKVANLEDEATGDGFDEYEFSKPLGEVGHILVPREKANNITPLRDALVGKNWAAPSDVTEVKSLLERCIRETDFEYRLAAAHVGWRNDMLDFVLHERVLGNNGGARKLVPPRWLANGDLSSLKRKGDLNEWIEHVAKPCRYSTRLMFAVSCAFAAPLLMATGMQSFGAMLYGPAKAGKSTAMVAAASVIGIGREPDLTNFNITDASFYEKARTFNDMLFAVNEVGLAEPKKANIYARLRARVYGYAEGRDTSRHSSSGFATDATSACWRGLMLISSERSCGGWAKLAAQERDAGEYARVFDVPVVEEGSKTIIDLAPNDVADEEIPVWARRVLAGIRSACEASHGVAIDPYLLHLTRSRSTLPETVANNMRQFEEHLALSTSEEALVHAARNFALVYAGACLGIEAGILPWSRAAARYGITACFDAGCRELQNWQGLRRRAIKILKQRVSDVRWKVKTDPSFDAEAECGFREKVDGRTMLTVRAADMRSWFPDKQHFRAVLEWLDDEGRLIRADASPRPSERNIDWAITSPRWTSTKKVKSIKFYPNRK